MVSAYNHVDISKIKDKDRQQKERELERIKKYDRSDPHTLLIGSYGKTSEYFDIDKYELSINIDIEYYSLMLNEKHETILNTSVIDLIEFTAARRALKFCNNME